MTKRILIVLASGGLFTLLACVGDDPNLTRPPSEAGADGETEEDVDAGPPRKAFVTSTKYPGSFGGYAIADKECADRAKAGNLTGTFKAWLSIGTTGAASRIAFKGGYVRIDGKMLAASRKKLVGGSLENALNVDESGKTVGDTTRVWTNTSAAGAVAQENYDCQGFTKIIPDNGAPASSPGGDAIAADARWTAGTAITCANEAHLYCFED